MISIFSLLFLFISIVTPSYGQVTCASGWVQNEGNCYLITPEFNPGGYPYGKNTGTWDQCNTFCPTSYPGATMFCVRNAAEMSWLSQFGWFYIGFTDMLPYGGGKGTKQYGWVTGCSSTYTNWAPDRPDNAGDREDWAMAVNGGQWDDAWDTFYSTCGCQYNPALIDTISE